jgi:peptidoglycan hydrolase-like protein with peptidoglycan-binding domain
MYSFLHSVDSILVKNQVREQIFSLLGNSGKTLSHSFSQEFYAQIDLPWYHQMMNIIEKIWNSPYKKTIGYIMIIFSSIMILPPDTSFAASESSIQKTFIVTAYYSPLPDQSFYLKGNFEAEKRLNGNGTNGASGKPVFPWMIAAPKTYAFGTHIFFPGLGLGTVEDRGWAIVEAWGKGEPYDRIDIWMWYGEDGLKRALAWGRREVQGAILTDARGLSPVDFYGIDTGRVNLKQFKKAASIPVGGISSEVIAAFADLGYNVDNGNKEAMILQFQLDHNIISSASEQGAWVYGPKTRTALAEAHSRYNALQSAELKALDGEKSELYIERAEWERQYKTAEEKVKNLGSPKMGDKGNNVAELQILLKSAGHFKGKITGTMTGPTVLALKKFQKSSGIQATGKIDGNTQTFLIENMMKIA